MAQLQKAYFYVQVAQAAHGYIQCSLNPEQWRDILF